MGKIAPFFGLFLGLSSALALPLATVGCGGNPQARSPSEIGAPKNDAPAEPDLVGLVVGTVGRDHLTKDGYPLTKIADIIDVFKPDMILVQVRPEPYKKQQLEDASYEMTYVNGVAGVAGVDTEPFDWFRDEDVTPPASGGGDEASPKKGGKKGDKNDAKPTPTSGGNTAAADPFNYFTPPDVDPEMMDAYKSETEMLSTLGPMTFADANNDDTSLKIWSAMNARIRYNKGYSPLGRRLAWMNYLASQAYQKQKGQVHRIMVVVNVRYRAFMEQVLAGFGAVMRDPVAIAKQAEQSHDSVPDQVIGEWNREIDRLKDSIPKHGPENVRQNILTRISILNAAVSKKGGCCVEASTLGPKEL